MVKLQEDVPVKREKWGKLEMMEKGMTDRWSKTVCFEKTK